MFACDDEPLDDAMTRKMDIALDAIGVKPGDHVLEVGGGWGAFVEYAGKRGIEVTTLTLSKESERYLTGLIEREQSAGPGGARAHLRLQQPDAATTRSSTWASPNTCPTTRPRIRKYAELVKPGGSRLPGRARDADASTTSRRS